MIGCRGVIEVGPGLIRELRCGTAVDAEMATDALEGIDDPVVLVDDLPTSVDSLWCSVLGSLDCVDCDNLTVVHPTWWAPTRIAVVRSAARTLGDHVVMRPRSWLLAQAAPGDTVVVEIAQRLVAVDHHGLQAEPRRGDPQRVTDAVVRMIADIASSATVVIDAPRSVAGADALAKMIVDGLAAINGITIVQVDDARLQRLAMKACAVQQVSEPVEAPARPVRRWRWALVMIVALIATLLGLSALDRRAAPESVMATTFLVEGHVAVEVPADWSIQRVTSGPGSARVQVTSPSDPQLALHVTQSPAGSSTLAGAAEPLKQAIDAEPANVFVDFNPAGSSAGRPAVTYREVRAGHDIRWAVIVDKAVRIAIGCQSRTGADDAVHDACELAVRSAHAIG
ncbi:type VII secretion-associated protein [Mycobacterium shimoidei]|uniref:Type VII secretion-associated protein n=1 Tax=Mycobacterium shimoidei TaxID=29313 RepID=A0A375YTA4_MYCSH|nr:type VII secretion-associated protein [Mycobacterium shimoidei]MCV7260542.1 type VII secretion-associated protein [Mycobacterium shimoidei]ORW76260.1 hypothetical protein AWC26_21220 [Mycobacterium shimoidei]SRX91960.1 hypothetical protein MSP7336_00181 [Mycobacterium shimoidei]